MISPAEFAATRHLIGLTQNDLATILNVNPRTVRGWESGKYAPRLEIINELELLRREHDETVRILTLAAAEGDVIGLPRAPKPPGWYLAIGARLLDQVPDAQLEWHD